MAQKLMVWLVLVGGRIQRRGCCTETFIKGAWCIMDPGSSRGLLPLSDIPYAPPTSITQNRQFVVVGATSEHPALIINNIVWERFFILTPQTDTSILDVYRPLVTGEQMLGH